jgi:3-oxoacyl-[acyl-carrier-protein] synthase-1
MAGADILGIGMMTAVGVGAAQTAASVRAGIARLTESAIYNRRFNPIVMSTLPDEELPQLEESLEKLPGLTSRQMRMLRLAGPALAEAVADVGAVADVPLLLAVPEALPGRADPAGPRFLEHLAKQSGVAFRIAASRMFPNGRAAGFLALAEALALIEGGTAPRVLVGGVDSYLDLYLLATLDAEDRVLADGVMDGFAPGEGAAFLLLGPRGGAGGRAIARVVAAASGVETGHRYSKEPYRGDGLAAAFQSVFATRGAAEEPVTSVLAGLNGEHFGAKEWGTAYLRSKEHFVDDIALAHPVDCFGDAGAALGPLLVGLSAIGIQKGYLREPCLAWCSSDRETRGAALLRSVSS